jgi:hypothetical protein
VNAVHDRLIRHELGHAVCGSLAGCKIKRVWAPPPDFSDGPPENPDDAAGCVEFHRGSRWSNAVALLGGLLADGEVPPWPIEPRTNDERMLAKLVNEEDPLVYGELVRDTQDIIESAEFTRMTRLASELLAHPPHELDGRQLNDIKALAMKPARPRHTAVTHGRQTFPTRIKALRDDEADDDLEARLAEIQRAKEASNRVAHLPPEHLMPNPQTRTNGHRSSSNGNSKALNNAYEDGYKSLSHVMTDLMPVQVATFDC